MGGRTHNAPTGLTAIVRLYQSYLSVSTFSPSAPANAKAAAYNAVNAYLVMRGVRPGFFPEISNAWGSEERDPERKWARRKSAMYALLSHCLGADFEELLGRSAIPGVINHEGHDRLIIICRDSTSGQTSQAVRRSLKRLSDRRAAWTDEMHRDVAVVLGFGTAAPMYSPITVGLIVTPPTAGWPGPKEPIAVMSYWEQRGKRGARLARELLERARAALPRGWSADLDIRVEDD